MEKKYRDSFASIPEEDRYFMASERAFQYLAEDYGLTEGFIWKVDTEENGSPDQIKDAINFVKKYQRRVLFIEYNVDSQCMQTVSIATSVSIFFKSIDSYYL